MQAMLRPALLAAVSVTLIALFFPSPDFAHLPEPLRPYRPGVLAFVNKLPLPEFLLSFDPDTMIRINQWRTGLNDLQDGDGVFWQGLSRLTAAIRNESALTTMGKILTHVQLDIWIGHRLALAQLNKTTVLPAIKRPVFVVGMPRSGTTFLHNLLSLDTENFRAPRNWEIISPLPALPLQRADDPMPWGAYLRFVSAQLQVGAFRALAPRVAAVHPISATNAEECMPLLALGMLSLQFNTLSNVSSYNTWMLDQDQRPAFAWHKIFLQALRSGTPANATHPGFLLKAPWHMNHIPTIFETYPDAFIINPHRHPGDMLASLASLHARFYGIVSDDIDPQAIGAYQRWQWKKIIERYVRARKQLSWAQQRNVADYSFEQVTQHPMDTVRDVYAKLQLELKPETEAKMNSWLEKDVVLGKRGAAGHHLYKAEWFGLDAKAIEHDLQEYVGRFL